MSSLMNDLESACALVEIIETLNENGTEITYDGKVWKITDIFGKKVIGSGKGKTLQKAIANTLTQSRE